MFVFTFRSVLVELRVQLYIIPNARLKHFRDKILVISVVKHTQRLVFWAGCGLCIYSCIRHVSVPDRHERNRCHIHSIYVAHYGCILGRPLSYWRGENAN